MSNGYILLCFLTLSVFGPCCGICVLMSPTFASDERHDL